MNLPAAFIAARAAEHRRRVLSYAPVAEPLRLPLRSGRVVSIPQVHVSAQALIDLELVGNPFVVGGRPGPWDAYRFLWRLHPAYARRGGWLVRLRLSWLAGLLMWPACSLLIQERMAHVYQDQPAEDGASLPTPAAPVPCVYDDLCRLFASNYGFTRREVLDAPLAWLLQLLRAEALAQPDGLLNVIDPSDQYLHG
jgi:hypothetical protein